MIITIVRAEGLHEQCDKPVTATSYAAADQILRQWSILAPEDGGYHKCDFTVEDSATGFSYKGRFDLEHWSCGPIDLKAQCLRHLRFIGGTNRPASWSEAQYIAILESRYRMTEDKRREALETAAWLEQQP